MFQSTYSTTILSGREQVWLKVIKDTSWAGHSKDYFESNVGIGSHNSFIEVLGFYGPIACIVIVLFSIICFLEFYFNRKYFTEPFRFLFINVFMVFYIFSSAEGMFGSLGKGIQLFFFTILGLMNVTKLERFSFKRVLGRPR